MTALSLTAFVGGWNLISQKDNQGTSQAAEPATPTPLTAIPLPTATPWPTLEPLPILPPVPTVAPLSQDRLARLGRVQPNLQTQSAALSPILAMPTLEPLVPVVPSVPAQAAQAAEVNTPTGNLTLLAPVNGSTGGPTIFEWVWNDPVPVNYGFEVQVWRNGEAPAGAHDAVADNRSGRIESLGGGRYRIFLDISGAYGVQWRGGDYLWTVSLVQINPGYANLGIQAPPAALRFDAGGSGGSSNSGGNSGGSTPPVNNNPTTGS